MRPRSSQFSPRLLSSEEIEVLTVGREAVRARLLGNLRAAISSGQARFDLVVGPRGLGKSHLFRLLELDLARDEALKQILVRVSLVEEFHPSSLLHLLAKVLESMPADDELPPVHTQLQLLRQRDKLEAEQLAVGMIRARLHERSLLIMLENLDEMFKDLGRKAQARLRQIVQTEGNWSMFATARSAKGVLRQDDPFHGTFVVEALAPLEAYECRELMVKLARAHELSELVTWLDSPEGFGDVHVIRQLFGGSPRVMAMILQHMDPERPGDLYASFYGLAEEVTPYYQEQIGRLSAGQKPVMEFLAERWMPASVSEIAANIFADPVSVSTHLRALRRDRLVVSTPVGKERFYELADPVHRIARAMKREDVLSEAVARIAKIWSMICRGRTRDPSEWLVAFAEPKDKKPALERIQKILDPVSQTAVVQRLCAARGTVRIMDSGFARFVEGLEGWAEIVFTAWARGELESLWRWMDDPEHDVPDEATRLRRGLERDERTGLVGVVAACLELEQLAREGRADPSLAKDDSLWTAVPFWLIARAEVETLRCAGLELPSSADEVECFASLGSELRRLAGSLFGMLGLGDLLEPFAKLIPDGPPA